MAQAVAAMARVEGRTASTSLISTSDSGNQSTTASAEQQTAKYEDLEEILRALNSPGNGSDQLNCPWEDVLESLQIAQASQTEYKAKAQKRTMRDAPTNRVIITTLLGLTDMIPDQNGLSVLRGGLKLVFNLLQTRMDNRGQILQAFEDIPMILEKACETFRWHQSDSALRQSVVGLYHALVHEIPKLAEILFRRQKGVLKLLKRHPEYESVEIGRCIDSVARASQRVKDRGDVLLGRTSVEILHTTKALRGPVQEVNQGIQAALHELKAVRDESVTAEQRHIARDEQGRQYLTHELSTAICEKMDERIAEIMNTQMRMELQLSMPTRLEILGAPWGHADGGFEGQAAAWQPLFPPPCEGMAITHNEILSLMNLPEPLFLAQDIETVLHQSNDLSQNAIGQTMWLTVEKRFRTWLQFADRMSDLILVDGLLDGATTGKISPLSAFCASFAKFRKAPHFLVLHHFCGLHSYPREQFSGPRSLLRALIAQVLLHLSRQVNGPAFLPNVNELLLHDLAQHQLGALAVALKGLLWQLPPGTIIYCLIDNISELETTLGGWADELCDIVSFLQGIICGGELEHVTLKVMLTDARRSIAVCKQIGNEDHVSLYAGNMYTPSMYQLCFEEDLERAGAC